MPKKNNKCTWQLITFRFPTLHKDWLTTILEREIQNYWTAYVFFFLHIKWRPYFSFISWNFNEWEHFSQKNTVCITGTIRLSCNLRYVNKVVNQHQQYRKVLHIQKICKFTNYTWFAYCTISIKVSNYRDKSEPAIIQYVNYKDITD